METYMVSCSGVALLIGFAACAIWIELSGTAQAQDDPRQMHPTLGVSRPIPGLPTMRAPSEDNDFPNEEWHRPFRRPLSASRFGYPYKVAPAPDADASWEDNLPPRRPIWHQPYNRWDRGADTCTCDE
jgi:hypothetical protein